ncbi:MAG: hypothetical protein M1812_006108 [Candelaria pacifica]|nr:MAG: hypothetical protein M1812_006108 [Candelaria pacifica]
MQAPPIAECNAALKSFLDTIAQRHFSLDETIEFLDPGTTLQSSKYARQFLTANGQYHTFTGPAQHTCIIRFFMFHPQNPTNPASSLSTYRAFHSRARIFIDTCVAYNRAGWARISAQGRDIGVLVQAGNKDDPVFDPLAAETVAYRVEPSDRFPIPELVTVPDTGGAGQGADNAVQPPFDAVAYLQAQTYCNTQQDPSTCHAGSSCQGAQTPLDDSQKILWGDVIEKLVELAGTCLAAKGGSKI